MFFVAPLVTYIPHKKPLIYIKSQQATAHNIYIYIF